MIENNLKSDKQASALDVGKIFTERLLLRRPEAADGDAVFAIHSDPETNRFNPNGPDTRDTSDKFLSNWIAHWDEFGFGYWAVCLPDGATTPIGFCGIMRKPVGDRIGLNLYFRFAPIAWGKGFASEAASAAMKLAFDGLKHGEVLAKVRPANQPSRRVLERLGMVVIGETDDVQGADPSLIYALRRAN